MIYKKGDEIYSKHTLNRFIIEYTDGNCVILKSIDGKYDETRCYYMHDIKESFRHVMVKK